MEKKLNSFDNLAEAFLRRTHEESNFIFMNKKAEYTHYSYKGIWNKSLVFAKYLQSRGIGKGDVVSMILPSCPEFIMLFIATQILGAVPVSLYPMMSLEDTENWKQRTLEMLKQIECQHIFGDHMFNLLLKADFNELGLHVHDVDEIASLTEELQYPTEYFPAETDLCFLQFSSGTTGQPKPVMITQKNAIINAQLIIGQLGSLKKEEITTVSWLPLYHDMGLVGTFISSILGGRDLVIIRPDDFIRRPYLWIKAISDHHAQITTAPNFAYGLCVKRVTEKQLQGLDLSSLQLAGCGGEAVYQETMDKFTRKFSPFGLSAKSLVPMYGMAEATVAISFSKSDEEINWKSFDEEALSLGEVKIDRKGKKLCSLGRPLDTFEVVVKDSQNNLLSDGQVGRIYLKGPSVFAGYYKDKIKTESSFLDDYLDTGDQGFLLDGEIFITGRAKDIMVIRGRNYYPTVYEESLTKIRELREGRVIVSSVYFAESDSEEMIVLAEIKNEKCLSYQDELITQIKSHLMLTGQLTPKVVDLLLPGTLPRTSSGKLRRSLAVKQWTNNTLKNQKELVSIKDRTRIYGNFLRKSIVAAVDSIRR